MTTARRYRRSGTGRPRRTWGRTRWRLWKGCRPRRYWRLLVEARGKEQNCFSVQGEARLIARRYEFSDRARHRHEGEAASHGSRCTGIDLRTGNRSKKGRRGGAPKPSRRAQTLRLEYPYGGPVGSKGWGPNSPSGACYLLTRLFARTTHNPDRRPRFRLANRRRSEEHTSELQSRSDLVCRLLL